MPLQMKQYTAPDGYWYLLDESGLMKKLSTPDDFNDSRLRLVSDMEAEYLRMKWKEEAEKKKKQR